MCIHHDTVALIEPGQTIAKSEHIVSVLWTNETHVQQAARGPDLLWLGKLNEL